MAKTRTFNPLIGVTDYRPQPLSKEISQRLSNELTRIGPNLSPASKDQFCESIAEALTIFHANQSLATKRSLSESRKELKKIIKSVQRCDESLQSCQQSPILTDAFRSSGHSLSNIADASEVIQDMLNAFNATKEYLDGYSNSRPVDFARLHLAHDVAQALKEIDIQPVTTPGGNFDEILRIVLDAAGLSSEQEDLFRLMQAVLNNL